MLDLLQHPRAVVFVLLVSQLILRRILARKNRSNLPLPPGPKGYIGIGNLFDVPARHQEVEYSKLAQLYGDMVYLETFGTKILVLSSPTMDLFEKRSSRYSDRSDFPMLCGQMGYDAYFSLMRYGTRWRRQRRLFHEQFNPTAVKQFHPLILDERVRFVGELYRTPKEFVHVLRSFIARILLKMPYGIEPMGNGDPFITRPVEVTVGFAAAAAPGAFLVDFIPVLKYVPTWFPGASWKRFAQYYKRVANDARVVPFQQLRELQKLGTAPPSALRTWIEKLPPVEDESYEEERLCAQDTAGMSYVAGWDTSLGAALAAFLMLALHPEVQQRAQEEIDRVVGFAESQADTHRHILHDPNVYPEPFKFKPERYIKDRRIDKQVFDPYSAAFGFGRRICPGRHVSLDSLYAMISSALAFFDIAAPRDENGVCLLKGDFDGGILAHPKPFECIITPRSSRHEDLIHVTKNLEL
ncbi:putative CyP450 monooxygenase [Coprinellus micaceus]|uniref:Putative CyP450 monooxygenase n=1 Tax=Coprinellus micaceus TaxID=71717 RepID=A0A4Y7TH07_COPMI|nr:putative CyP450 monooxygenase [Coprinellus micaceus]